MRAGSSLNLVLEGRQLVLEGRQLVLVGRQFIELGSGGQAVGS